MLHVNQVLMDLILQPGIEAVLNQNGHAGPSLALPTSRGRRKGNGIAAQTHVWQVRHAGLLGMKYEVAVRPDLVDVEQEGGREVLKGIVEAALLG